ncbi:hypothetical protein CK203_073641 [Vitis vinifera]|uniref:Uncharacterized protein n=1 Tax=Vitis vinifera TaxID=29760 RepID=A0A438DTV9_VITVI|nr:hypothetical protein CK203_073641 [Vitis vinifera]
MDGHVILNTQGVLDSAVAPAKGIRTGCPDAPSDGFVSHGEREIYKSVGLLLGIKRLPGDPFLLRAKVLVGALSPYERPSETMVGDGMWVMAACCDCVPSGCLRSACVVCSSLDRAWLSLRGCPAINRALYLFLQFFLLHSLESLSSYCFFCALCFSETNFESSFAPVFLYRDFVCLLLVILYRGSNPSSSSELYWSLAIVVECWYFVGVRGGGLLWYEMAPKKTVSSARVSEAGEKAIDKLDVNEFRERFSIPNGVYIDLVNEEAAMPTEKGEENVIPLDYYSKIKNEENYEESWAKLRIQLPRVNPDCKEKKQRESVMKPILDDSPLLYSKVSPSNDARTMPREGSWKLQDGSQLCSLVAGKVPSARMQSSVVLASNEEEVKSLGISMFLVNLKHLRVTWANTWRHPLVISCEFVKGNPRLKITLNGINFVDHFLNQGPPAEHKSAETPIGHESPLHKGTIQRGLRFPLPALFKEFLHFSQIPPIFIHPNLVRCVRSPALPSNGDRLPDSTKGGAKGLVAVGVMGGAIAACVGIEGPPCGLGGKGVLRLKLAKDEIVPGEHYTVKELPLYQEAKEADAERRRKLLEDRDQKKTEGTIRKAPGQKRGPDSPPKKTSGKRRKLVKKHGKDVKEPTPPKEFPPPQTTYEGNGAESQSQPSDDPDRLAIVLVKGPPQEAAFDARSTVRTLGGFKSGSKRLKLAALLPMTLIRMEARWRWLLRPQPPRQ